MSPNLTGYFAVARGVFDHVLFKEHRALTRLEAWLWLIGRAAWKPTGLRRRTSILHVDRGQFAATIRDLATLWRWPKSTVERFLAELVAEGMIALDRISGTKTGTVLGTKRTHLVTRITICHYDKFQARRGVKKTGSGHSAGRFAGQESLNLVESVGQVDSQPDSNQNNHESKRSPYRSRAREKPAHGAKGRGMVWLDSGSDEWTTYAEDYRTVTGAEKLPETRNGGRGNWFHLLGQATAKKRA